jgi:ubiquinone/menaquinone biosynthesis C-methylase UbiE
MHERRFSGDINRLRAGERVARLEVQRVVQLCLEGRHLTNVLDVGTGTGLFAEEYAKQGIEVSGIDANPAMLYAARNFVPHGWFIQATAENLPFKDETFDLVFYGLVLHEADNAFSVLEGAWRVCRLGVGILEWPYREQPFGPPLSDRLRPDILEGLFRRAGFTSWEQYRLDNTDLYRLAK